MCVLDILGLHQFVYMIHVTSAEAHSHGEPRVPDQLLTVNDDSFQRFQWAVTAPEPIPATARPAPRATGYQVPPAVSTCGFRESPNSDTGYSIFNVRRSPFSIRETVRETSVYPN